MYSQIYSPPSGFRCFHYSKTPRSGHTHKHTAQEQPLSRAPDSLLSLSDPLCVALCDWPLSQSL